MTDRDRLANALAYLELALATGKVEGFVEALERVVAETQNDADSTINGVFWTACRNAARAGREFLLLNKSAMKCAPPRKRRRSRSQVNRTKGSDR